MVFGIAKPQSVPVVYVDWAFRVACGHPSVSLPVKAVDPATRYSLKATTTSAMTPRPAIKPAMIPAIEHGMGPTSAVSAFISLRC
jgi:hypothetical protein